MSSTLKKLIDVNGTADSLSLGLTVTKELIARGEIGSVKVGARRLVPVDAITDFVERLRASNPTGTLADVNQ